MQLELPIRWSETDREASRTARVIDGEDDYVEKVKYTHSRLIIDAHDIGPFYALDERNTMINDKLGKVYCVTIPFDQFKKIHTEVTGKAIMTIQVRVEEETKSEPTVNKRKRPIIPPEEDEDSILL